MYVVFGLLMVGRYFLFDCPGQVELYTHHSAFRDVLIALKKSGISVCLLWMLLNLIGCLVCLAVLRLYIEDIEVVEHI